MASFTVTAASGKFTANHDDFVCLLDLSNAPSAFWADVDADGGNIRVFDATPNRLQADVVAIDTPNQRGLLAWRDDVLSGSDNEFTIDTDGSFTAGVASTELTLTNPDAETGDASGWTNETGTLGVNSGDALEGTWRFLGSGAESVHYQDAAVPGGLTTDVDNGDQVVRLTWLQSNPYDDDRGELMVEFYDGSPGSQIGSRLGAGLQQPASSSTAREMIVPIPANTRTIRIFQHFYRTTGSGANSAILDDIHAFIEDTPFDPWLYGPSCWSEYFGVVWAAHGHGLRNHAGVASDCRFTVGTGNTTQSKPRITSSFVTDHNERQGVAWDGTHYYLVDNNRIAKYDAAGTLVTQNTDPVGDAGVTGSDIRINGDCDVAGGVIYVGIFEDGDPGWLAKFDASDLSFIEKWDATENAGGSVSAVAFLPADDANRIYSVNKDLVFVGEFTDGNVHAYDTDGVHEFTLANAPTTLLQSMTFAYDEIYAVSGSGDLLFRCQSDGTQIEQLLDLGNDLEGIDYDPETDELIVNFDDSVNTTVYRYELPHLPELAGPTPLGISTVPNDRFNCDLPQAAGTSFLLGGSVAHFRNNQDAFFSLNAPGGGSSAENATVYNEGGTNLALWDSSNGFLDLGTPYDPPIDGTVDRVNAYYDGTTERVIYQNGGNKGTDATITARGAAGYHLTLGAGRENAATGPLDGSVGFAYVRTLPANVDEFVADENSMLDDNADFWSVAEATTPPGTPTVTIDAENETSVDASTSAFSAGEGGSHTHTQWQITNAVDTSFASPVYNPGDDASNLTSIDGAGTLTPDTDYLIRARHKEDDATYSDWSTAVAFSTTFGTGIRYVPVALGDTIVVAGKFVMENGSDATEAEVKLLWHSITKAQITTDTPIAWTGDDGRKQATVSVQQLSPGGGVGLITPYFISWRIVATGDNGETSGLDYVCAWRNPPAFNLSASISLDGSNNVDLEWEASIPCRVKYVANTTGYVSSANVEANGTFTDASELTSDTEEDVISTLSGTAYITLVPFDMDDKRSGPRYLVPTVTN